MVRLVGRGGSDVVPASHLSSCVVQKEAILLVLANRLEHRLIHLEGEAFA